MLTLVVATAAVLATILTVGFVVILIFLLEIRRFVAATAAALECVEDGAGRFAGRIERIGSSTEAAAGALAAAET